MNKETLYILVALSLSTFLVIFTEGIRIASIDSKIDAMNNQIQTRFDNFNFCIDNS